MSDFSRRRRGLDGTFSGCAFSAGMGELTSSTGKIPVVCVSNIHSALNSIKMMRSKLLMALEHIIVEEMNMEWKIFKSLCRIYHIRQGYYSPMSIRNNCALLRPSLHIGMLPLKTVLRSTFQPNWSDNIA